VDSSSSSGTDREGKAKKDGAGGGTGCEAGGAGAARPSKGEGKGEDRGRTSIPLESVDLADLLRRTRTMSLSEVCALVPVNENGEPTSVGSVLHLCRHKSCKPCVNVAGCIKGVRCRYCHFPVHNVKESIPSRLTKKEKAIVKAFRADIEAEDCISTMDLD